MIILYPESGALSASTSYVKIAVFRRKMEGLHAKMETLHGKMEGLHGKMGSLHGKMEGLRGKMGSLHGKMEGLHGKMESLHGKMESLHDKMESLHGRIEVLTRRIQGLLVGIRELTGGMILCTARWLIPKLQFDAGRAQWLCHADARQVFDLPERLARFFWSMTKEQRQRPRKQEG